MTQSRYNTAGALGALAVVLLTAALPVQAQDEVRGRHERGPRIERAADGERPAMSPRQWQGNERGGPDLAPRAAPPERRFDARAARVDGRPADAPPVMQRNPSEEAGRNATYTAPRDRSYGGVARNYDVQRDREARDAAAQARVSGGWQAGSGWRRDRSGDARPADWQRDRQEHRDDRRNYARGYRDANRDDNRVGHDDRRWDDRGWRDNGRYGQDHRRWDNRGWRNDHRYDWYGYRAANRSIFSIGRYYAPYRGYSYSQVGIGFRLGSMFYSNRYWINDPWHYRLPSAYGPYRWVRYYDDALLVDIYSGEVVDVIRNFFW